jgi:chemotaxis response regulator CheB
VERVRTLAVTISPLLANLLTDVLKPRLPLDLIGIVQNRATLAEALRASSPDLVVLGLIGTETDAVARPFFAVLPATVILVLSANGHCAWLHQRRRRRVVLAGLSVAALGDALVARFGRAPPKE